MKILAIFFSCVVFQIFGEMTLEEKLGQLFIVPACPQRFDDQHLRDLNDALKAWHIGGFILKAGTVEETKMLVERLQKSSSQSLPLLIAADAEWGVAMRIPDAPRYPRNMTLGAIQDLSLIEQMGKEIALQMKSLGIHLNLAPVVDVNSNPKNPIIYMRSFGDNPQEVSKRSVLIMKGMESNGVLTTAKHFPGHGDTFVDSHQALPLTENYELLPFQALIDNHVSCVMTAHLLIPSVDTEPVTLSKKWVTDILRGRLGFQGLIITDALNMKGIAQNTEPGEVAVQAFIAGHDLLLYGDHINPQVDEILEKTIPTAIAALKKALIDGRISIEDIDARVQKILDAKKTFSTNIISFPERTSLPALLYREALTEVGQLPKFKSVSAIELGKERQFASRLQKEGIGQGEEIILIFGEQDRNIAQAAIQRINPKAIVLFGSPYLLSLIPKEIPVLLAYEETPDAWDAAAAALAGKILCKGRLPVKF
jgi:beta-N-acetylhexosaminidase